jgi:hypothetical protein
VSDRSKIPRANTGFSEAFITNQLPAFDPNKILVLCRTRLKAVRSPSRGDFPGAGKS